MIGASVCTMSMAPFVVCIARSTALTIPEVTVCSSPKGLPIAIAVWPTCSAWLSARAAGLAFVPLRSIFTTATSVLWSAPTTVPVRVEPSARRTVTVLPAPDTTWAAVRMWPAVS